MRTDTGIEPDSISRHIYVSLDIFREQMQNKAVTTELEAWLTLLSTQNLDRIGELVENFEGFDQIYNEIFQMRTKPEELIKMYDSCFRELDRNEEQMYLEELQDIIAKNKEILAETKENLAEKEESLAKTKESLAEKEESLAKTKESLAEKEESLAEKEDIIAALKAENERLKAMLKS
jgi:septal ring factor EnvC (AmiA/AmiB activator)